MKTFMMENCSQW